jgi:hypothetical protein
MCKQTRLVKPVELQRGVNFTANAAFVAVWDRGIRLVGYMSVILFDAGAGDVAAPFCPTDARSSARSRADEGRVDGRGWRDRSDDIRWTNW